MLLSRQSSAHHKQVSGASVKNKNVSGWQVVSARRTAVSTLRVVCFKGRTARARCVTTHLWTARLWLACLFRSSHYARHDSRHHQSPLLSPPRQACLRHASRAQARAPPSLSFYRGFPKVKGPSPSAQPVSVSRSRATGCITLAEFCLAKLHQDLNKGPTLTLMAVML